MALIRGFSRVDAEGRIPVAKNMMREAKLLPGQLVEIKIQGAAPAPFITIKARQAAR